MFPECHNERGNLYARPFTADMTALEMKDTGRKLFQARQYAEAVPLLKAAAAELPQDEVLWQELVLAASWTQQHLASVDFCKSALRSHPRSDWLWRQLGSESLTLDLLDEAEKALQNARSLNRNSPWLWRYLAAL